MNSSSTCTCVVDGRGRTTCLYCIQGLPQAFFYSCHMLSAYIQEIYFLTFYLLFIALSLLCNGFGHFYSTCSLFFAFSRGRLILFWTESVFVISLFCFLTANAVSVSQYRVWQPMPIVWQPMPCPTANADCLTSNAVSDSQWQLSESQCRVWQPMPIVWQPMPIVWQPVPCLTVNAVSNSQCRLSDSQCRLSDGQCRVWQPMPIFWQPVPCLTANADCLTASAVSDS